MKLIISAVLLGLLVIGSMQPALATLKDDIGYTQLVKQLGANVPTGAGVMVTQVEANASTTGLNSYRPNPAGSEFTGKTIIARSGSTPASLYPVFRPRHHGGAKFLWQPDFHRPGHHLIDTYLANHWEGAGFSATRYSGPTGDIPRAGLPTTVISPLRLRLPTPKLLRRMDWLVNRDEYIQVVAASTSALWGSAFNAIAVGLSSGSNPTGAVNLGSAPYGAGRTQVDLVVPQTAVSYATPVVAAASALLVQVGQSNPGLSRDPLVNSTQNRLGDTIYNADRSEVVKAALMAGASRTATQLTRGYTVNTANGLNSTLGAGQLNISNSYNIIAAGEQNSREDYSAGGGGIKAAGFDYDPYFGRSHWQQPDGHLCF